MSSLSQAGKSSITNQINRAFTKGLYGVDPSQLQRRQMQRRVYQQELKQQADQQLRRKQAQKARQRQQDQRLQRKIQFDIMKEKQQKQKNSKTQKPSINNNPQANNNLTNSRSNQHSSPQNQKKNFFNASNDNTMAKNAVSAPGISLYKNANYQINDEYPPLISQPTNQQQYSYVPRSIYNMEEQKYYHQEMQNRVRRFKETLDRKLQEVYKQIQSSKRNQNNDNVVDQIKRRLKSNSYMAHDYPQMQKSGIKQFEDQYSQFYRIPKRSHDLSSIKSKTTKNLDYDSQSRYKSSLKDYGGQSRNNEDNSRMYTQRPQKSEYNDKAGKWGNKRSNNYLGNRQALDYKIQSTLSNIDNIIQNHNKQYGI